MTIAADSHRGPLVARILAWLRDRRETAALKALDDATLSALAADCGVSRAQLLALAEAGPHAADEMEAMMQALNIDAANAWLAQTALLRDMQIGCSRCAAKDACRHDLAAGTAPAHFSNYCSNADALNAMRAEPDLLRD